MSDAKCLICDVDLPTYPIARYCKECRAKQQKIKQDKAKKLPPKTVSIFHMTGRTKVCEFCQKTFTPHKGIEYYLMRFCSAECRSIYQKYIQMFTVRRKLSGRVLGDFKKLPADIQQRIQEIQVQNR